MAKQDKSKTQSSQSSKNCGHTYATVEIVNGRARNRCDACGLLLP